MNTNFTYYTVQRQIEAHSERIVELRTVLEALQAIKPAHLMVRRAIEQAIEITETQIALERDGLVKLWMIKMNRRLNRGLPL